MSTPRWLAGSNPRRTLIRAAVIVGAAYVLFSAVLMPVRGVGISMFPTIEDGDYLFVNRLAYRFREPRRGDVVAVRIAGRSAVYVKRLLALPGDQVQFKGGLLYVNGEQLDEPYVVNRSGWTLGPVTLADGEYFVVGDNRGMRMDLHEMGTTTRDRLLGPKVLGIYDLRLFDLVIW